MYSGLLWPAAHALGYAAIPFDGFHSVTLRPLDDNEATALYMHHNALTNDTTKHTYACRVVELLASLSAQHRIPANRLSPWADIGSLEDVSLITFPLDIDWDNSVDKATGFGLFG
jgi:hypothetical protein